MSIVHKATCFTCFILGFFIVGFSPTALAQDSLDSVPQITIEALDLVAIAAEDEERDALGLAPRFAIPKSVEITPENEGVWEKIDGKYARWRLRVTCKNAISMNFGFHRWFLPLSSEMVIYNYQRTHKIRPFTIDDYADSGELWTPAVAGGDVIIEITCPLSDIEIVNAEVQLNRINPGYRGFHENFGAQPLPNNTPSFSGSCNIDVACPESVGWENEIDCVGVISTGGSTFCTGFMVNNTSQDGTPFFMTADHCGLSPGNTPSLVVYWNYENSTCRPPGSAASGGPGNGTLNQFSSGAIYRAGSGTSDFTLVELNSPPNSAFGVSFCGWDASTAAPTSAVGIHHPNTEEKRISFENQAPTLTTNFVTVEDWDAGTTEPGSSGSPLFDQNHRVIGQLCCGGAACGNNLSDDYGRFSRSWNLGLSSWLDSAGTGQLVVDTLPSGGGGGPVELCSNGADDDGDGLADCEDPDCASSPACLPTPPGDDCDDPIAATDGANAFNTSGFTNSAEPIPTGCTNTFGQMANDGWLSYTASSSGQATFNTCDAGSFDTDLAVYSGTCGSLTLLGCDGDGSGLAGCQTFDSEVVVDVIAGQSYLIRVGGFGAADSGPGTVTITVGSGPVSEDCTNGVDDDGDGLADCADPDCAANPACGGGGSGNDECIGAVAVFDGANAYDTTGFTNSVDPIPTGCPNSFGGMNNDGWFVYTATSSGSATFNTCDPLGFDTDLAVYSGDCSTLALLACDGDGSGLAGCQTFDSEVITDVIAGENYLIRIGGFGAGTTGPGTLTITVGTGPLVEDCTNGVDDDGDGLADCADPDCAANPACGGGGSGNDECAGAVAVFDGANAFDTTGFTDSLDPAPTGCTNAFGANSSDGWFIYTATADGLATFNTCDPNGYDTDLSVYSGTCGALNLLGCDGDGSGLAGCQLFDSEVVTNVIAGENYIIRIGGFDVGGSGPGTLTITVGGGPLVEDCTNGVDDDGDGLADCADPDCFGNPACGGGGGGNDECAGAVAVFDGVNPFDTTGFTDSPEPDPTGCTNFFGDMSSDGWFTYTATDTGTATFNTCDPGGYDTDIAVYAGTCGALALLGCDGDSNPLAGCQGFASELSVSVVSGETYIIRIGGFSAGLSGPGTLTISTGTGPLIEDCTNGVDDDGDGLADCADPDCAANPACGGGGGGNDECTGALAVFDGANAYDTFGLTNSADPVPTSCSGGGFGGINNDGWFAYTATSSGSATFNTCDPNGFDTDIAVYSGDCTSLALLACDGDGSDLVGCQTFDSEAVVDVIAGETYTVRIGAFGAGTTGTGTLTITVGAGPVPENCTNGTDDDGDGLVDCEDTDCDQDPACAAPPVENCTNGTDDDGDGLADCADPDCSGNPNCVTNDFTFFAEDTSATYSPDTGTGSFSADVSAVEDASAAGYPNETQGFSFGLSHDASLLSADTFNAGSALSALNAGSGPDFLDVNTFSDGITCGCVYSFSSPGTITLQLASQTTLGTIAYNTVPSGLIGNSAGVTTSLNWSNALGAPPVINIMVVNGQANPANLINGSVDLVAAIGGFVRGDVNDDGGINIADAVSLLAGLFTGGLLPCADAADANDDGSTNIADAVYVLANLFSGGPGMPAPTGPACGPDPTTDALDCASYNSCP